MIDLFISLIFILILALLVGGIVIATLLIVAEALPRRTHPPGNNQTS
jgi:hypothetical protein